MLGSTTPIYEVVSGQILLGRHGEFFQLHRDVLLPMLHDAGIEPVLLLVTEVGRYLRFLDIYEAIEELAHAVWHPIGLEPRTGIDVHL